MKQAKETQRDEAGFIGATRFHRTNQSWRLLMHYCVWVVVTADMVDVQKAILPPLCQSGIRFQGQI